MLSFETVVSEIENRKGTQSLGFFNAAVRTAILNGIFVPGGAAKTVENIEQRILKEKSGSGQNVQQHSKAKIITLHCGKCNSRFTLSDSDIHRRCGLNGCEGVLHKIA